MGGEYVVTQMMNGKAVYVTREGPLTCLTYACKYNYFGMCRLRLRYVVSPDRMHLYSPYSPIRGGD